MKWYMQRLELLENVPAFNYLEPDEQQLVRLAFTLWQREYHTATHFVDYSFIVFPMAKAYEGFLKRLFLDLGLIYKTTFMSHRFRIGRALNPDVRFNQRDDEWLYDDLVKECGPGVARRMWDAWLMGRNRVFHYFPGQDQRLTLEQTGQYIEEMFDVMQASMACKTDRLV